jgi:hypothetical protein
MLVQIDADELHVSGLRLADQVAGATQVEVARADRKARAQPVERLERAQSLERGLRDRRLAVGQQHHLPSPPASADPAAQLVKLRQSEAIRVMHDHRVRARDVEPRFDDVGREQHVAVARRERHHRLVDLARRHLAVRLDEAEFRHELGELRGKRGHVVDARNDDEALPTPRTLTP